MRPTTIVKHRVGDLHVTGQAWARVEQDRPDWHLRIVGPSERNYVHSLRKLAADRGVARLSFEDALFRNAKISAYREADLFVSPTLNENFGMVVAEALAQGTPVICTKGAPWEGLQDERCGWWIDHGFDSLASTLNAAMSLPPSERAKWVFEHKVGCWIKRDFSWGAIARQMHEVYSWLKTEGENPACVSIST